MNKSTTLTTVERISHVMQMSGCDKIYVDKPYVPRLEKKPFFKQCLEELKNGDVLCITSKYSVACSVKEYDEFKNNLMKKGVTINIISIS